MLGAVLRMGTPFMYMGRGAHPFIVHFVHMYTDKSKLMFYASIQSVCTIHPILILSVLIMSCTGSGLGLLWFQSY